MLPPEGLVGFFFLVAVGKDLVETGLVPAFDQDRIALLYVTTQKLEFSCFLDVR